MKSSSKAQVFELPKSLPHPKSVYSYSKLTMYDRCSEMFKLKYVDGVPDTGADTVATRLGGICHTALENFYLDETGSIESPFHVLTASEGVWDAELKTDGLLALKPDLETYAHHMTILYERASASYTQRDAIRKADGSVALAPQLTSSWKAYVKQHRLDLVARKIDSLAAKTAPEKWRDVSLADVYSQTVGIMYTYTNPENIDSVVSIELPISQIEYLAADENNTPLFNADGTPITTFRRRGNHRIFRDKDNKEIIVSIENEFYFPKLGSDGKILKNKNGEVEWDTTCLINGYIDMLARDVNGNLLVIDHKTSGGEVPAKGKVARHEQLLLYGFIIYHLSGELPAYIGINHLRSGRLILSEFSLEKAELAVERLAKIKRAVELDVFIKQDPDAYGSKCCIKKKDEVEFCQGLKYCHPEFYKHASMMFSGSSW